MTTGRPAKRRGTRATEEERQDRGDYGGSLCRTRLKENDDTAVDQMDSSAQSASVGVAGGKVLGG